MIKKTARTLNVTPKQFKDEVLDFLNKNGQLIPTTNEEVELFEKMYGSTNLELPEELKNLDEILEWGTKKFEKKENHAIAMAAHGGNNISDNTIKKMKKLHEKIVKVHKTKK